MKVTRVQIRNLHAALEADPTIEVVELQQTESGRVSFYRPETVVKLTRIRVVPKPALDSTLASQAGKTRESA